MFFLNQIFILHFLLPNSFFCLVRWSTSSTRLESGVFHLPNQPNSQASLRQITPTCHERSKQSRRSQHSRTGIKADTFPVLSVGIESSDSGKTETSISEKVRLCSLGDDEPPRPHQSRIIVQNGEIERLEGKKVEFQSCWRGSRPLLGYYGGVYFQLILSGKIVCS